MHSPRFLCNLALAALTALTVLAAPAPTANDVALRPVDIPTSLQLRVKETCPDGCVVGPPGSVVLYVIAYDSDGNYTNGHALEANTRASTADLFLLAILSIPDIKIKVASIAGVDPSQVDIIETPGSTAGTVRITAIISIPAGTTADAVRAALAVSLATVVAASNALGITVESIPTIVVAPGTPPVVHGDPMFKINGVGTHFCAPLSTP